MQPRKLQALSTFGGCFQAPKIGNPSENLPKVSSRNRRNSRFGETFCGDEFRSSLSGGAAVSQQCQRAEQTGSSAAPVSVTAAGAAGA